MKRKKTKKTVLMFGYECNNKCIFCYNDDKRYKIKQRTTNELKKEIDSALLKGSTYLEIIGGEPTIRKDITELIKYAKRRGFQTIMFATNGRMFYYKEFAQKIIDAGITDLVFSIHGHTPKLHDHLTGSPGSFEQMIKGIQNLKELRFNKIGSNTTIVKQNYKHLPEIGKLIYNLGIRNSEFIFVDPTHGPPKHRFHELVPKISEVEEYVHKCLEIGNKKNISHWDIRYFPLCYVQNYLNRVSELKETLFFHTEHIAPDFVNYDVEESRKNISRQKTEKCKICKYSNICEGVWKEYLKHNGDEELRPEPGPKIQYNQISKKFISGYQSCERRGDISDIYYSDKFINHRTGSILSEIVGLISGAKRVATFEFYEENEIDFVKNLLNRFAPNKKFNFLKTPPYNWIKNVNPAYKFNLHIGQEDVDLHDFEKYYKQPQPHDHETNLKSGQYLSYPDCCTVAFRNLKPFAYYFKTGIANKIDYRINNFYKRSASNVNIIRHYVCNYHCKKSLEYAEHVLKFLKINFPQIHIFFQRVLKMPLLVIYPDKKPTRTVGQGVVITFDGHYENEKTLMYGKAYNHGENEGTQYLNKDEGKLIFNEILKGNKIKLKREGIDIYNFDELKKSIKNDRLVFINPV